MFSRRILVDLDAIFDTRIGLVLDKYPTTFSRLEKDFYVNRISEVIFEVIGIDDWTEAWKGRDVGALKQAQPTELMYDLHRVLMGEISSIEMSSPNDIPELTFNYYPYVLTADEVSAMKHELESFFIGFKVSMGRWCEKSLTPTALRRSWDAWFTYDWYRWIEHNAHNLENRIPKFIIYRPALLTSNMTEENAKVLKRDGVNPFTESKKFMAEYVTTEPLDAKLFSVGVGFFDGGS